MSWSGALRSERTDGLLGSPALRILVRFPGPVTLRASRLKWFGVLGISAGFTIVGLLIVFGSHDVVGWLPLSFFGLCTLVSVVALLPGASTLTLTRENFVVVSLYRRWALPWLETDDFAVIHAGRRMVGYNAASLGRKRLGRANLAVAGRSGALPDSYGLKAEELALLMTLWREMALK